jgi:hypothetical protein
MTAAEEMLTQVIFAVTDATAIDGAAVVNELRRRGYELNRAGELERTVAEVVDLRKAICKT